MILPDLKHVLVDPVPEVRRTASVALGTMVGKIGETSFEGLVPWLLETLKSESSQVDRSGAAQGSSFFFSTTTSRTAPTSYPLSFLLLLIL